jgi:hypothetical protein
MEKYRRIVERIQGIIYSSTRIDPQEVASLATEYRETCEEVNGRLRDVGELLRQGLRSEALHKSDVEPNLLDVVTVLDFPELPQWLDLTSRLRLPRAPGLMIDVAGDLDDAYTEGKPLEELMHKHRKLAIARAPMPARIAVLRQIAHRDFKNAIWRKDLQEYEAVRIAELRGEIDRLCDAEDLGGAAKLQAELKESPWVVSPAASLVTHVDDRIKALMAKESRRRMAALADRLEQAMEDLDTELAASLLGNWQQLVNYASPSANDPAVVKAQRVIAWVQSQQAAQTEREEEEFQRQQQEKRLADFKAAVKGNVSEKTLLQRREELRRQGVSIPDYLEGQYQERLKQFRIRARIRIAFILSGILAAVLLVAGLIWHLST